LKQVAVLGSEAFTLGFQLAGIRKTVHAHDDVLDTIHVLRKDASIGLIIAEDKVLASIDSHDRSEIEDCVSPVFITLSTEASGEDIRKLIMKSIGVDLWKG